MAGRIYVGVGGWNFEPWRGAFYPKELPRAKELSYMAEHVTAIEVNATFYRSQTEATFRKWADTVPEGFRYAIKASRYTTSRRALTEGIDSIERFLKTRPTIMGAKLGPIVWQLPATKKFDKQDIASFLPLLPVEREGVQLRHVIEAAHESFADPDFVSLLRDAEAEVAPVLLDKADHPMIGDATADFVYLRLERSRDIATGYPKAELDAWVQRLRAYAAGDMPVDLPTLIDGTQKKKRDVYAFFIAGEKARNPAAAMAMIERL